MNIIVAADNLWGIGNKGNLLYRLPQDQKYVRDKTANKVIVMGHSTLSSFPDAKPLKNRVNIVLSRDRNLKIEGAVVCNSVDELLGIISQYNTDDVFIFGGEMIYSQLIDYCSKAFVTKIDSVSEADAHFIDIDNLQNWRLVNTSETFEHNGIRYTFNEYENIQK